MTKVAKYPVLGTNPPALKELIAVSFSLIADGMETLESYRQSSPRPGQAGRSIAVGLRPHD